MHAAFAADGIDRHDVVVVQRGSCAGFVAEARELPLVEHSGEGEHLESDSAAQ
jgi:hypothetical protein